MSKNQNHSLTKLADAAFEQVAEKVIEQAKATGTPVVIWEHGKMKEVDPDKWSKCKRSAVRK